MSRIKYFIGEARKNIIRNGLMSVASLFTIVSCLVILGIFMIISLNVETVTNQIKDQCEIQVFLDINTSDERVNEIHTQISAMQNVKSAEIYTKEQMLEEVKTTMFKGREELIDTFDAEENPFSDSYKIVLNDISLAGETAEQLSAIENVESVTNKQDVVNVVISISENMRWATIIIMLLLLLVAVVIISNTVRLTVFNRRKEIGIMKYIGATDRFIRIPFIFEGVLVGIAGAIVAFLLMFGAYSFILNFIDKNNFDLFTLIGLKPVASWLAIIFFVVGGLIGMLGSMLSMKKYLKV
ncbi:MAG: permease-like cell division protein FtsX [Eubacteriales bacterium]|nr:permease-like cell division protein FtsX [Eubacteriales bacterium]